MSENKNVNQLAVIFDMDGVLVDSIRPHYETWASIARDLDAHLEYEAFRKLFGQSYPAYFPAMGVHNLNDAEQRKYAVIKEERYRDLIAQKFPIMAGVADLIGELAAAGFLLAVGSSGPRENVELAIAKIPNGNFFNTWTCSDDVKIAKPAPDIFLCAAAKLQIAPEKCVVIEDSIHGLVAAHRAGMFAVAITTTSPREELAAEAELVVDTMSQLNAEKIRSLFAAS